jgi:ceramide glucosyltransferase
MSIDPLLLLACLAAAAACAGVGQSVAGMFAVRRYRRSPLPASVPGRPKVSLLKPLCGEEPLLEAALASVCSQDYPDYQVVFGIKDRADPAIAVVERLRRRFPHRDIALVIDPTPHGSNRKVANLINMLPAAPHDILVIADSDLHCAPDYLGHVVDALLQPGVGLATTLYAGLPANASLAARLGATAITHGLLPGVLMARALGRQDCLGATMALRRFTLEAAGGLPALAGHLADDHLLGRLVQAQGLSVRLARTIPATTVPETRLRRLFSHELRWSRTIQALVPGAFAASCIQHTLGWALLAAALSGFAPWAIALFATLWAVRAATARGVDGALGLVQAGLASKAPVWLLPLRDIMSLVVFLASYAGDQVEWRGQMMHTGTASEPERRAASAQNTRATAS